LEGGGRDRTHLQPGEGSVRGQLKGGGQTHVGSPSQRVSGEKTKSTNGGKRGGDSLGGETNRGLIVSKKTTTKNEAVRS